MKRNTIHQQAYRAVSTESAVCSDCGAAGRLHRHHEDYARPLDVVLLCPVCHGKRHLGRRQALGVETFSDTEESMDGERLKYWRLARTMTIRDLANRSGVNHSAISAFERNIRRPHPETIRKLAEALGVEPRDLLKERRDD